MSGLYTEAYAGKKIIELIAVIKELRISKLRNIGLFKKKIYMVSM